MVLALFLAAQLQTPGSIVATLRDSDGHPLTDALVAVDRPDWTRLWFDSSTGEYRGDSVPPGRIRVTAGRIGYAPLRVDTVIASGQTLRLGLVLKAATFPDTFRLRRLPSDEAFGLGLFRQVAQHAADSNVFLSPASAASALAMAYRGAGGTTRTAIALTLGGDTVAPEESFSGQRDVELMVANSIWAERGLPFLDSFLRQAPTQTVELQSPEAQEAINAWVAKATKGKIPKMVSGPLPDSTVMLLLNAVYFKGLWATKFDSAATRPHPFTLVGGTTVNRPLMFRHARMQYRRGPNFQAVRLPYRGGRMAMYVFLPDSGLSIAQFVASMDAQWMQQFGEARIRLGLPKFRIESETTLNEPLAAMGMGVAFDEQHADFSGMLPRSYLARKNVFISKVVQKTYVDVDEQGTEAAAATDVVVAEPTALMRPIEMIVDRPFVAAIRDDKTGQLLFVGQITDPRQR